MINVISVPQALRIQFIATLKARRGPCIAVPQGAAVVPIITFPLTIVHSNFHCYYCTYCYRQTGCEKSFT